MTYTALAVTGVLVAIALDRWVARTRLTTTRTWWSAYAIIVFFQLLTNGWLTSRRIVQYDPDTIIGDERVSFLGDGRILYAPVEDLAFGFALVLTSCVAWMWLGRRSGVEPGPAREEAA
ncbi:lycopene cyclase domain-containing protein [Nocardioides terrigena]|uniref:lycopene cyclase domain-containing protein n=1 Tax=Nocardioides terrigena TaxID=424797 RepID=UPI000D30A80D|nr:lycopene cyclase domain-containing protein [Nocardioides terrigena]